MTDLQTVTLNECRNDASTVHLYFLDEAGMWRRCAARVASLHTPRV